MIFRRILNWLMLGFWICIVIAINFAQSRFELFQWLVLELIAVIGLMLANHFVDWSYVKTGENGK